MREPSPVIQFSIFAENKVGRLIEVVKLLSHDNVHPVALTTLDTTDSSFIRMVVDDPDHARALFKKHGVSYHETIVLVVELDAVTDLQHILACLLEVEINIHYAYAFLSRPHGHSALVLQVEDRDIATQVVSRARFRVLTQRDIAR
jgi:hypothetical protein